MHHRPQRPRPRSLLCQGTCRSRPNYADRVPVDVRLINGVELSVDESSLTGENSPINKTGMALTILGGSSPIGVVNGNGSGHSLPLTEQKNIVFMGTLVVGKRDGGRTLRVRQGCQRTERG
mmetsp:Transcript_26570/g.47900  ORF Transcript_26570/g.47900 Transcript_26570/m.47900 type:complete len:121 (+) Transcript_26570:275-637(+)